MRAITRLLIVLPTTVKPCKGAKTCVWKSKRLKTGSKRGNVVSGQRKELGCTCLWGCLVQSSVEWEKIHGKKQRVWMHLINENVQEIRSCLWLYVHTKHSWRASWWTFIIPVAYQNKKIIFKLNIFSKPHVYYGLLSKSKVQSHIFLWLAHLRSYV